MKKSFLLAVFLLAQCSFYDLSFEIPDSNIVITEPFFNVLSPTSEIISDELEIKLEMAHPDGISSISIDGEIIENVTYSKNPQYISYTTKVLNKYSDTYLEENGQFKFTVDIQTPSSEQISTDVTLVVHRGSTDDLVISYDDTSWSSEDYLQLTSATTGAGISSILDENNSALFAYEDYNSINTASVMTISSSSNSNSIITNTNSHNVYVGMNKIFPNGLNGTTNKNIKYVTTGNKTNTFNVGITVPYTIKLVRDNNVSVSEWLPMTIYVKDPNSYSHIYIDSPNASEKILISDFEITTAGNVGTIKYEFDLAYNENYIDPYGTSKPYSTDNGEYNVTVRLYKNSDADSSPTYAVNEEYNIHRKVMDNVQISYPYSIPSNGVWSDSDVLKITTDNTGDTIGTVIITWGSSSISFDNINSYEYSIRMDDIWFFKNPTSTIFSSITVIPTRDNTQNNTYTKDITIVYSPPSTDIGDYVSLGTYIGNPPPSDGYIYYPVIISEKVYENYVHSSSVLYFYTNDNNTVQVGTASPYGDYIGIQALNSTAPTTVYLKLLYDPNTAITHDIKIYADTILIDEITITTPIEGDIVNGVNGITISTIVSPNTSHTSQLAEIDGYTWYSLDIDISEFNTGDYISVVMGVDYDVLDIVYFENNNPTKDTLLRVGNINSSKTYYVQIPNEESDLYLKIVHESSKETTYTKLN